jgi:hypothetical protein
MKFTTAHNRWLDPPEEPEAVLCDDCGEEMEVKQDWKGNPYAKCKYQWCPGKFDGDAQELASMLIEANETIKHLREQVRRLKLGLTK